MTKYDLSPQKIFVALLFVFLSGILSLSADQGAAPESPLFIDPNTHGSCDPEVVYNPSDQHYYIYYTTRRPHTQNTFLGTPLGVIRTKDLQCWEFLGYCNLGNPDSEHVADSTFWAPAIIEHEGRLHMFVTWKPDLITEKGAWGGQGFIVHYSAPLDNPVQGWVKHEVMHGNDLSTIDASVFEKDGLYHLWFKGKRVGEKKNELYHIVSSDMENWESLGFSKSDVFNKSATGSGFEEAPYVFRWKGKYWLITDPHLGLFVYSSDDADHWIFQGTILKKGGNRSFDGNMARHCSVAVIQDRAFIFYHVEPWRIYESKIRIYDQPLENRRSVLQMAELKIVNGQLTCDRNSKIDLSDLYLTPVAGRWSKDRINAWYADLPWLVGCNYYPATAINQIDMWQGCTWDPTTIDQELKLAASIGMNTLRVYLHDLVWADDEEVLYQRMDEFLDICTQYEIRPWFVFFDDCHYPEPKLGEQPLPIRNFHNSGWVNSPGRELALRYADGTASEAEVNRLKGYVQKTIDRFRNDERILMWELYNEPGNGSGFEKTDPLGRKPGSMRERSNRLVYDSWSWAREMNPSQPICSNTAGSVGETNVAINRINSDLHSIHAYNDINGVIRKIKDYQRDGRPVIVSEWLARTAHNTVFECLPVMKDMNVGAINWGFISGKSGTVWPWSSRKKNGRTLSLVTLREQNYVVDAGEPFPEPKIWFHDLFRSNGTPYDPAEIELFRKLTTQ